MGEFRMQVRDMRNSSRRRLFDVIVDGDNVSLEIKTGHCKYVVPWNDIVTQVNAAKSMHHDNSAI